MYPFSSLKRRIRLLRYRIVWRVNTNKVKLPVWPTADFSRILAATIAARLPSHDSVKWQNCLSARADSQCSSADLGWPVDSILAVPCGRRVLGLGEPLVWELKLFGEAAHHDFFMGVILPALEEASYSTSPPIKPESTLWGHFDMTDIHCAHGRLWEPVVRDGILRPRYQPTRIQWCKDLWEEETTTPLRTLILSTPLGFPINQETSPLVEPEQSMLDVIMAGLENRLFKIFPDRKGQPAKNLAAILSPEEEADFNAARSLAASQKIKNDNIWRPAKPDKHLTGSQTFANPIPSTLLPFLDLASILHVGQHIHTGYGAFILMP